MASVVQVLLQSGPAADYTKRPLAGHDQPTPLPNRFYSRTFPIIFNDGEVDDDAAIALRSLQHKDGVVLVAEHHRVINKQNVDTVFNRNVALLQSLQVPGIVLRGSDQDQHVEDASLESLKNELEKRMDGSVSFLVLSHCTTLARLCERYPDLVAQKVARIVWQGGLAYRDGVYYTTHNLSENTEAAQALFKFIEVRQIPTWIISTDALRAERFLNFDIPEKLLNSPCPTAKLLCQRIEDWNIAAGLKQDKIERLLKYGEEAGYQVGPDFFQKHSMTPADVIASAFDAGFRGLVVTAKRISNVEITDEPRIEDGRQTKHRKTTLDEAPTSSIRYVTSFRLKLTQCTTTESVEAIANDLINQLNEREHTQHGVNMAAISSVSSSTPVTFVDEANQPSTPQAGSAVAAPSGVSITPQPAPMALPTEISAVDLMPTEQQIAQFKKPSAEEIQLRQTALIQEGNLQAFFDLYTFLKETKAIEFHSGQVDDDLRDAFFNAFQAMYDHLNKNSQLIKNSDLNEAHKAQLTDFSKEGRGPNSLEVYTTLVAPFNFNDPKYGSKLMDWSKGKIQLRPNDLIPGINQRLIDMAPGKDQLAVKIVFPENCPTQAFFTPRRAETHEKMVADAIQQNNQLSESLSKFHPEYEKSVTFFRGGLGFGKTKVLGEFYGIDESIIPSSDTLKKVLRMLSHNECSMLADRVFSQKPAHSVIMKTNTRPNPDLGILTGPKDGVLHVVEDIAVSRETLNRHISFRKASGGRAPGDQELDNSFNESQQTRPALIQAAMENERIEWYLINNNQDGHPVRAAEITGKKFVVQNQDALDELMKDDPLLANALKEYCGYPDAQPVAVTVTETA